MKTRIINVLTHPPGYELYKNEPRPRWNRDISNGTWVGIWGNDWPDVLGSEILKITDEFEYEVWQPDVRADKIYQCTFDNGLKHLLFPARTRTRWFGLKQLKSIYSSRLAEALWKTGQRREIILQVNEYPAHFGNLTRLFAHIPSIVSFLGEIQIPRVQLFSLTKNLPSKINSFSEQLTYRSRINDVDVITYSNDRHVVHLKKIYRGGLEKLTMGCDFSFWSPRERSGARRRLNLDNHRTLFFTSSNLIAIKQIDKMIAAFKELDDKCNYLYIIAGHGCEDYEKYLKLISQPLLDKGKIKFVGFVSREDLRDYYRAADFFVLPSQMEGASVAIMKAMACGVPVISTNVGGTAELMAFYNAGCLLDKNDHRSWSEILKSILEKTRKVTSLDRETARKCFDWPEVAQKFLKIYVQLSQKYYGEHGNAKMRKGRERE